jgi:hypothetical protein
MTPDTTGGSYPQACTDKLPQSGLLDVQQQHPIQRQKNPVLEYLQDNVELGPSRFLDSSFVLASFQPKLKRWGRRLHPPGPTGIQQTYYISVQIPEEQLFSGYQGSPSWKAYRWSIKPISTPRAQQVQAYTKPILGFNTPGR